MVRLSRVAIGNILGDGMTIENGANARSELTFVNRAVVRLGARTSLHLKNGAGAAELRDGAILFQIPKGSNGEITAGPVSLTSKGATGLLGAKSRSVHQTSAARRQCPRGMPSHLGESVVIEPGQIMIMNPKSRHCRVRPSLILREWSETCRLLA